MKAKKGGIKVKEGGDSETAIPSQKVKKQIAPSPGNKSTPVGKKNQKKKVPSDVQNGNALQNPVKTQKRASQSKGAPEVQIAGKKRKSTESKDGSCAKLKGQTPAKKQKSKVVEEQREGGADEPLHPFKHDPADDCETCLRAYQDISPFLTKLAQRLGKPKEELCIWDPYYCAGQVKVHLKKMGFKNVVNENKDFYALIDNDDLPPFDVLMTSPPYSRDHIERCMEFAVDSGKPFFLLMPQYVHRKAYYDALVRGCHPFFMYPKKDYVYYAHHGGRKDNTKVPCRHFMRDGKCRLGDACQFLHGQAALDYDPSSQRPPPATSPDGSKALTAVTPFKSIWHLHFATQGANDKLFTWAVHKLRKGASVLVRSAAELPLPS